ncbi:Regulatory protein SoxS [compost metagenome]
MRQKFQRQLILEPREVEIEARDEQFLNKIILAIETHMEEPDFGVDMLAEKIGMSQSVLYKKLKALTNMSVNDFSKSIRLKRAAQLLKQKQYTVYEIGYMVGFTDRKYFSREFKKQFGQTPSDYKG